MEITGLRACYIARTIFTLARLVRLGSSWNYYAVFSWVSNKLMIKFSTHELLLLAALWCQAVYRCLKSKSIGSDARFWKHLRSHLLTSVGSNISSMYGLLPESFFISFSAADIDGLRCDYCPYVQCSQCMLHCILIINIRQMIVGLSLDFSLIIF